MGICKFGHHPGDGDFSAGCERVTFEKYELAIEFIRLIADEDSWVYDPYMGWGYPKNRWDAGLLEKGGSYKDCKDIAQELLKELKE